LSEIETEKYGRLKRMVVTSQAVLSGCEVRYTNRIPVAILTMLAQSATASLWRTQIRTHRAEVHEAGEGDGPEVHGIDHIASVELEEKPALDTWTG